MNFRRDFVGVNSGNQTQGPKAQAKGCDFFRFKDLTFKSEIIPLPDAGTARTARSRDVGNEQEAVTP